jgi:tripartite-type tricarboxylate transporter receptor subunit TctC
VARRRLILPSRFGWCFRTLPGGIIDVGRTLAQKLTENLGRGGGGEPAGGGGVLGTDSVARSAPDGYTLVLMDPAIGTSDAAGDVPYDRLQELQTVSIVSLARGPGHQPHPAGEDVS